MPIPHATYQAQLTLPGSLARIQATRPAIEHSGGSIAIHQTDTPGITIVVLRLPAPLSPDQFLPGLPFFLVSTS